MQIHEITNRRKVNELNIAAELGKAMANKFTQSQIGVDAFKDDPESKEPSDVVPPVPAEPVTTPRTEPRSGQATANYGQQISGYGNTTMSVKTPTGTTPVQPAVPAVATTTPTPVQTTTAQVKPTTTANYSQRIPGYAPATTSVKTATGKVPVKPGQPNTTTKPATTA